MHESNTQTNIRTYICTFNQIDMQYNTYIHPHTTHQSIVSVAHAITAYKHAHAITHTHMHVYNNKCHYHRQVWKLEALEAIYIKKQITNNQHPIQHIFSTPSPYDGMTTHTTASVISIVTPSHSTEEVMTYPPLRRSARLFGRVVGIHNE